MRWALFGLLASMVPAFAQTQDSTAQELLRQQERERVLREQQETTPDVRLRPAQASPPDLLPPNETPCFPIERIRLDGEDAHRFLWSLKAADPRNDPATGRCLGTDGINVVMARVQNAIVARGFVTTRILASPQDLKTGTLTLTVVPGRIRYIRFAPGTSLKATAWNAVPAKRGDLLNLRDIEQALENFKRVPTVFKETKKSGFLYNGGVAFTVGSQTQSGDRKDVSTHAAASTIGSTGGDVTLVAGNHYQQTGSHVLAPKGDIDIHAKQVDIVEARETGKSTQESKFRQSGVTVALTSPVISAVQTAQQMKSASGNTSDTRMKALAAATTGLAAVNAYDAVSADPQAAGGLNISITAGSTKSDSKSTTTYDTAAGSTVAAGGDVRISATGAGQDSDITVRGSNINAGGNAHLKADGDINLLAAQNTVETDRTSSNSSAGVGVAISVGQGGVAMGITANASRGKGKGEGKDVTWTNSHVTAGERLTLESGGDTNLRGAVASGKQVVADVGGNLNIESLQDTSTFKSKDTNVGGSVTVGAGFSASANVGRQKIDSDYASVTEQSRIEAGDGGFQLTVKGNTDLKGAAITSSEQAVMDGLNTLTTGTLTTSDIKNHAEYKASSVSIGGGYSSGNGGMKEVGRYGDGPGASGGVGTNQQGQAATGGQVPGTTLPTNGNFSASQPIVMAASGNSSSTTHSGISGAQITITDEAGQQALTGQSVDERIASLNRDVFTGRDGANALKPIFNEQEIKAGFEIVGALQRETGTFLNNRAKEATDAQRALEQELAKPESQRDPARLAALQQKLNDSATWAPGGTGRQVLTALAAAAGGNVTGASSQFAQGLVVNYLQQQGAGYIGKLVKDGVLAEGSSVHASLHALVACAGAAASNQNCGSGALGAAASSLLTNLFLDKPGEMVKDKEAKRDLIATLVAGIAAVGGLNVATATNSAIASIDNNYLTQPAVDKVKACLSGKTCSSDEQKKVMVEEAERLSQLLDSEMNALCAANPIGDACRTAVNAATQYIAMQDAWAVLNGDVTRSSKNTFDYVYNSLGAEARFALYYNTIDNRANFFGASDRYEQNIGSGAKWFGGAESVSRAGWTGLGADGSGSSYTFLLGAILFAGPNAMKIYDWRAEAGNALMTSGFANFRPLYNSGADPVAWDIKQLQDEQRTLQPIHEKYMKDRVVFSFMSSLLTDSSDYMPGRLLGEDKTQTGGVDILDYDSRIRYGCKLLGYGEAQGCKP
ncbi:hemagglutinin repeat-containing protein [Pseudomonas aeruginosa]|uniref:hemagglutinin repeat-containing protein n=1 Tax=Pseudomonas aeruginosa TaxID=287 RepID=UPI003F7741B0